MAGKRYKKKPVVIEAMQLHEQSINECMEFCEGKAHKVENLWGTLDIDTLEGVMRANCYDWIIKGVKGEFYPCKPDIFEATYEAIEEL